MDMDQEKIKKYLACCGCATITITIIVLFSFDTVEPVEWGLKYNTITKQVDNTYSNIFKISIYHHYFRLVYEGGRHLI